MTLKASKHKTNPQVGLFCSTVTKNAGIIILLSIGMLIFCPGFMLTALSKQNIRPEYYASPDALNSLFGITAVLSCIFVCIGDFVSFSYLYKKSSSDVFHALPLTRNALLVSRSAASLVSVLIPVTLGYISLCFLTIPYPYYVMGTLSQIASAYIANILLMLAVSAFSLLFIICAGSGFDLLLSFAGFNVAVLAVAGIINGLCGKYLSGYSNSHTGLFKAFSPIYYLIDRAYMFAEDGYKLSFLSGIIPATVKIILVFFVLNFLLYNYRKAERGEQAYAYKFIYIICGILAGICGGYALSEIFILGADTKEFSLIGIISFIAGAIITTVVYGAVTDRGFKNFKRSIIVGAGSVLAYGIITVIILTGAFGFKTRIPVQDKITHVSVSFDDAIVEFDDPEDAIALHKAIIDKNADDDMKDEVEAPHTFVELYYNLNGNREFARQYFVSKEKVKKELFKVYASDSNFDKISKAFEKVKNNRVELWGSFGSDEDSLSLDGVMIPSQAKELLSVYREELINLGEDYFSTEKQERMITSAQLYFDTGDGSISFSIRTTSDFEKTNTILQTFVQQGTNE